MILVRRKIGKDYVYVCKGESLESKHPTLTSAISNALEFINKEEAQRFLDKVEMKNLEIHDTAELNLF